MVANGAEPVSAQTLRRFIERFARYGFRRGHGAGLRSCREGSVGLAFPPLGRRLSSIASDREALSPHGVAEPARPDDPRPLEIVACGQPLPSHEIRIVDEAVSKSANGGRDGSSSADLRRPRLFPQRDQNARTLSRWLARQRRPRIYGRRRRLHHRPHQGHHHSRRPSSLPAGNRGGRRRNPGNSQGGGRGVWRDDRASGTERVVVLAETRETDRGRPRALQVRAHEVTIDIAGTPPDEIVLAPPHTVPKTSSGKIRRSAAKELYDSGRIGAPRRAVWRQILRLSLAGIIRRSAGSARFSARRSMPPGGGSWW